MRSLIKGECRETVLSLSYPLTFITINLILIDIFIIDQYMVVCMLVLCFGSGVVSLENLFADHGFIILLRKFTYYCVYSHYRVYS